MYCSNCGAELREGAGFCTRCGQPVTMADMPGNASPATRPPQAPLRRRPSWTLIAILAVCAAVAIGAAAWLWWQSSHPAGVPLGEDAFPDKAVWAVASSADADGDGMLSPQELAAVTTVDLSGSSVSTLEGVGRFTAVEEVKAPNCPDLTAADLSDLPALSSVDLTGDDALDAVDVRGDERVTSIKVPEGTAIRNIDDTQLEERWVQKSVVADDGLSSHMGYEMSWNPDGTLSSLKTDGRTYLGTSHYSYDYRYDEEGRLLSRNVDGTVEEQYTYDGQGRVATYARWTKSSGLLACTYAYDANGRLSSIAVPKGGPLLFGGNANTATTETLAYDGAGRLLSVTCPGQSLTQDLEYQFGYDDQGRCISSLYFYGNGGMTKTAQFTLDASGRRISDQSRTFAYDDQGRLSSIDGSYDRLAFEYGPHGVSKVTETDTSASSGTRSYALFAFDYERLLVPKGTATTSDGPFLLSTATEIPCCAVTLRQGLPSDSSLNTLGATEIWPPWD